MRETGAAGGGVTVKNKTKGSVQEAVASSKSTGGAEGKLKVLFQNEDYIVVHKPFDVKMDGPGEHTLEKMVRNHLLEQILSHQHLLKGPVVAAAPAVPKLSISTLSSFVVRQKQQQEEEEGGRGIGQGSCNQSGVNDELEMDVANCSRVNDINDAENCNSNSNNTTNITNHHQQQALKIDDVKLHFVHQLDYATSGAMCLALNSEAAARGCCLFSQRLVQKRYVALVNGHVDVKGLLKKGVVDPVSVVRVGYGPAPSTGSSVPPHGQSKKGVVEIEQDKRGSGVGSPKKTKAGSTLSVDDKSFKSYIADTGDMYDFQIDYPIAPDVSGGSSSSKKILAGFKMCIGGSGDSENPGKESVTLVKVIKRGYIDVNKYLDANYSSNGSKPPTAKPPKTEKFIPVSLVQLTPFTGRRHQLRLHLQKIGHPIVGDYNYEKPYHDTYRMFLHAYYLYMPFKDIFAQLDGEGTAPRSLFYCRECVANKNNNPLSTPHTSLGGKGKKVSPKKKKNASGGVAHCFHFECANYHLRNSKHLGKNGQSAPSSARPSIAHNNYSRSSFHQLWVELGANGNYTAGVGLGRRNSHSKKRSFVVTANNIKTEDSAISNPETDSPASASAGNKKETLQSPMDVDGDSGARRRRRSSSRAFTPSPTRRRKISGGSSYSGKGSSDKTAMLRDEEDLSLSCANVKYLPHGGSRFESDRALVCIEVCALTDDFDIVITEEEKKAKQQTVR
eukprot:Nk52_evm6s324 gene=Nk52_evmTU6s324